MMTETQDLKDGDRVRVVLEGSYQGTVGGESFYVGGDKSPSVFIHPGFDQLASIEKLSPPLPTTPGSVIRRAGEGGDLAFLRVDGKWMDPHGDTRIIRDWRTPEVVFDAGAGK